MLRKHFGGSLVQSLLVLVAIIGVSLAHYITPPSLILWHNIFQRLYYLPIVVAAIRFGWIAGLVAALVSALLYIPHILGAWHSFPGYVINQYAEIVLFFLVGSITGLLADEQRKKQAELELSADQLARANRELRESSEHLKRADRLAAVGNLSAGLAHEIRNPLASIEGAAGILENSGVQEEQRLEFLGIIKKECRRLNRLLENLLDFARPRPPQHQTIPVASLLDSVVALVSHSAGNKTIRLHKEVSPPGLLVDGDAEQLKQVLLNLLLNAIQAMPDGGDVRVSARTQDTQLLIEVVDQGIGIAAEDADKMFNPFFTTKEKGTGLGLAIAHQIVAQHDGILQARSNAGGGMTFSILLPLTKEMA